MTKTFSIYRSSAGSGKTRTLAKEYLKLALEHRGYYFRHILAVTFTNKSTQEMKDRILAYLDDFANGRDKELAEELKSELHLDDNTFQERSRDVQREILHNYSQFSISTIDAFFQKVIRSFTREAGLMGDYRLEVDTDLVLEEVIDDLIDELGSNKELTDWVVEFARENLENERAWDVRLNLREFAEQIFKEEFKAIEDDIIKETNDHGFFKEFKSKLWQSKNSFLGKVSKPALAALKIMDEKGWDPTEISFGKNSGLTTFFKKFAFEKNLGEHKEPSERMRSYFTVPEKWPSKTTVRGTEIKQTAKEKLIPIIEELINTYDQYYEQGLSAELALNNFYSFGLIADISRKLKEYKTQNNLMLLADAPKFLNEVIQDSDTPFIYEKVGSFYRNFLIDEFQDTSGYQWKNFLPLLTNSLDQGNRSIVVGDVKQAVYRWRGGDLNLLQEEVEQQIGKDRVRMIELDTNFRSASHIVDFNNKVFKGASSLVSQVTNGALPANAFMDVSQKGVKKEEGYVQVQFIKEEPKDGFPSSKQSSWKEIALEQVAIQLEQLQGIGVKLSDIAILVRKNLEGQEVATYLLNYANSDQAKPNCRYDVISNESLRLDGAASVNVLLAAMRYLQNPDDSIARAQLGYEYARLKEPSRELSEVFTVANQVFFESNLPEAFAKSKTWLKKLPLFELTETLIEIFKIGDEKGELTYLQAFQDLVLDFYSRERNDLGAFLEWWETNKNKKSLQVSGEVNAVQILTVHRSKGLQFKYVLIPFCSWNMDHDFYKEPLLWVRSEKHPFQDAGYLPIKYGSKLEKSYFKSYYEEELIRVYLDNLNLLYVACTRAENGLFITAPNPGKRETVAKLIFDSIHVDLELQKNWNANTLQWKAGVLKPSTRQEKDGLSSIELKNYPSSRWRDKLIIKRSSTSFFEKPDEISQEKIRYGIHMHAVLSRIRYESEISDAMNLIVAEGLITESEMEPLSKQLNVLLSQPLIRDWFTQSWDVRTEVPVLLPGGEESRIDRLMVKDKKAIVVDFKTGERNKRDQQQVLDYINVLRQMNFSDVEGYVLYLRDMDVLNVMEQKAKISKRKENKDQLGLDFDPKLLKPFLQALAEKLYHEHPQLDEMTLVFPNRRAALYFRKYLTQVLDKPAFAPKLITIEEFIAGFSTLKVPDKLELVHRLYKSYYETRKPSPNEEDSDVIESFDQFYFWGEMLVRDFDEVDKYLVNAELLFKDLSNQKELDASFDFFTDEQKEFLKSFWGDFNDQEGKNKKKFLQVWQRLPEVHKAFKKQLLDANLGYEGMVHCEVAEKLTNGKLKPTVSPTWFVGFNALTLAEEKIISWFVEQGKAEVHWDVDAYYLNNENQEAGEFFRQYQNHRVLGKTFSVDVPSNFQVPKSVKVLGAAQPVGQAKLMSQLLHEELDKGIKPEETLIVLPDEKLMLPVLHGISASVDKLNVTMGFPLSNTPMFNLIELLVELQTSRKGDSYNHRQVLALLGHSYIVAPNPAAANEKRKRILQDNMVSVMGSMLRSDHVLHKQIFCEVTERSILDYLRQIVQLIGSLENIDDLDKEYALYFLKFLNRMEDVLGTEYSNLKSFLRLFRQLVKAQKIPFTGEPLKGLQVMGVLETRNLDFKNVFILSLNEGALPSGSGKGSYIPYNIRRAYQLPTVEHQDAIYAYLFYRVLQRAENVFLFYNSETDVLGQGEMSRYLQQLLYESGLKPERKVLHNPIQPLAIKPITIAKNKDILEKLSLLNEGNVYFKGISPSALNSYIECRLKFYFRYIAKIKEPNEVEEDIDARVMGNFLHDVMELFYKRICEKKKSKSIDISDFDQAEKTIDQLIEQVFITQYHLEPGKKVEFEGQRLVVREVVKRFAMRIVSIDMEYAPFTMEAIEQSGMLYRIKINQPPGWAVVGGKIDRVDSKEGLYRIIDYKTGKDKLDFESIPSLFVRDEKRNKAAFQTLLYALLYKSRLTNNSVRMMPGLINRMNLFEDTFQFGFKMNDQNLNDVGPLLPEFEEHLRVLLEEIFSPEEKFDQTPILESCRICPYQNICYR